MSANTEAVGYGFEHLLFLVDAPATSPPPSLVDERSVSGIHEADDSVIDVTGQIRRKMGDAVTWAEDRQPGRGRDRLVARGGLRHVYPDVAILLFAREVGGKDALDSEFVSGGEGGNSAALASFGVEAPSVIATLQDFAVEPAKGKRYAAVRTTVAEGEGAGLAVPAVRDPADHERRLEEHRPSQLLAMHLGTAEGGIPEALEHS